MDLVSVKLNGFKRFEKATLNTSGKVVALVGANEAGKSSILEALTFLNDDRPFDLDLHLTRNKEVHSSSTIIIEAIFFLNDDDVKSINDLFPSEFIKTIKIQKLVSGKRIFEIDFEYDISLLASIYNSSINILQDICLDYDSSQDVLIEELNKLIEQNYKTTNGYNTQGLRGLIKTIKWLKHASLEKSANISMSAIQLQDFPQGINCIIQGIKNNKKNREAILTNRKLSDGHYRNIDEYYETLNENYVVLVSKINEIRQYYKKVNLNKVKVVKILRKKIPLFIYFDDSHRNLLDSYNLKTIDKSNVANSLSNLLKTAKLELNLLIENIDNRKQIIKTIETSNLEITQVYAEKWSQSEIIPVLDVDNTTLRVFIKNKAGDFYEPTQRSDGLRRYIALINFLEKERSENPILLVDEAELHLHYDAQADLMEIFSKQQFASKIIYTTHSVGCLPEDLGTGVKLVSPIENVEERSTIKKNFWSEDQRPGVIPLLFGMGASQLSFMAVRQSVFVEGATDMLLLPTLFRQATKRDHLGFQIVPGIAMTSNANFGLLENHAPKVAFLVDRDRGGEKYIQQLKKSGIEENRIYQLPEWNQALVLEDYVRKELYLEAVNNQIKQWNNNTENDLMSVENIPDSNRPQAVENWCKDPNRNLKTPEKVSVTYELLDLATGERQEKLIGDSLQDKLSKLYESIIMTFSK